MRGIVTQVENNDAVLLSECGDFIKIKNKNYCVGQSVFYKKSVTMLVSLAASFIIFFLVGFAGLYYSPDNYISIDINPSIQLTTNRFSKVIMIQSFNDEGKLILERSKIKNKSIENAMESIVSFSLELGYLSENNNEVVIDLVKNNESTQQKINQKLEKFRTESIVINIEHTNKEMLELSRELAISVGRTKAIYEYTNIYGGDLKENKEILSNQTVGSIKKGEKPSTKEMQSEEGKIEIIGESDIEKGKPSDEKINKASENLNKGTRIGNPNQFKSNEIPDELTPIQSNEGKQNNGESRVSKPNEGKQNDAVPDILKPNKNGEKDGRPNISTPNESGQNEGRPNDSTPNEGGRSEGRPSDSTPNEGGRSEGRPNDSTPNEGGRSEGKPSESAPNEGRHNEGTPTVSTPNESGQNGGSQRNGDKPRGDRAD